MNDDKILQEQQDAPPRPFAVSREFQPAPPRPVMATDDANDTSAEPWPFTFGHDEPVRQTAPQHEQPDAPIENEPFVEPSEQPRPDMAEHGQGLFSDVVGHGQKGGAEQVVEPLVPDEPTWPVAVEKSIEESEPVELR